MHSSKRKINKQQPDYQNSHNNITSYYLKSHDLRNEDNKEGKERWTEILQHHFSQYTPIYGVQQANHSNQR